MKVAIDGLLLGGRHSGVERAIEQMAAAMVKLDDELELGLVCTPAYADRASAMGFLPEEVEGRTFYEPGPFGFEKDMGRRLAYWEKLRRNKREEAP